MPKANRLGRLIDHLLAFSRTGRREIQKTRVNLNELIREVVANMQEKTIGHFTIVDKPDDFYDALKKS